MMGFPVTESATFVLGVVQPLAGNVQRNAADLGRQNCQKENQGWMSYCAGHGGLFV
jgi:hypothetical protein